MPDQTNKFYLTTPIYYVNARPHIGHAYTTIVADVLARRHRLLGDDTFFLTGTDEHGQKIERSAAAAGIPPQQFADQVSASFEALWHRMGITHDDYIRTTDPRHKRGAQKLFSTLYERGFIYLASYTGSYCVSDEAFIDAPVGTPCPDCGRLLEEVTEENFFFKLSEFQLPLLNLIESNELLITPEAARNEVLRFLRGRHIVNPSDRPELYEKNGDNGHIITDAAVAEHRKADLVEGKLRLTEQGNLYVPGALKDLSISRSSFTWGIPVPEPAASQAKQPHVIYVWLDALANYMTALGYGSDDETLWQKFWPADLHLVGKEITRFHCVYWPAFLLAAGLPTPKQITANGWLLFDNAKMSKSKGNIVRTETILDAFGTLCPPQPADQPARPNPVIPSERAAPNEASSSLSARPSSVIPSEGAGPNEPSNSLPTHPSSVILSEGAGHHPAPQSKDLLVAGPATTAKPISTSPFATEPPTPTEATDRRGTASAVPSDPSHNGALAPEAQPSQANRDLFAADILRYYLLREIPFGQDGTFSFEALITRYNADLANGYGNLVSRVLNMIQKYFDSTVPNAPEHSVVLGQLLDIDTGVKDLPLRSLSTENFKAGFEQNLTVVQEFVQDVRTATLFSQTLEIIVNTIRICDAYITHNAPWKMKSIVDDAKKAELLYTAADAIRIITAQLHPILPYATARVWAQLGLGDIELAAREGKLTNLQWGGLQPGTKLGPLAPIFPRAPKELAQIMTDMENPPSSPLETSSLTPVQSPATTAPDAPPRALDEPTGTLPVAGSQALTTGPDPTPSTPSTLNPEPSPQITIDDFAKIDLRVAQITLAERIPKADKLLRLEVDLGPLGTRQILSGIAEHYTPEELTGRRIVVIANLAPRKMRGLESHGMLLAASDGDHGKPHLATCGEDIPLGSRLK